VDRRTCLLASCDIGTRCQSNGRPTARSVRIALAAIACICREPDPNKWGAHDQMEWIMPTMQITRTTLAMLGVTLPCSLSLIQAAMTKFAMNEIRPARLRSASLTGSAIRTALCTRHVAPLVRLGSRRDPVQRSWRGRGRSAPQRLTPARMRLRCLHSITAQHVSSIRVGMQVSWQGDSPAQNSWKAHRQSPSYLHAAPLQ
jgi:hypothetical protein